MLRTAFSNHICAVVSRKQTRRTSFVAGFHGYVARGIPAFQHSTWPYLKQVLLFYLAANLACGSRDHVFPNLHLSRNKVLAQLNTCHRGEEGVGICCDA